MKLAPLTPEDVARTHWHIKGYGLCQQLADGMVTQEQIRKEVELCPVEHQEYFRHWLNHYRQQFKAARACQRGGAGTQSGSKSTGCRR